jgi:hypothetical protein
LWFPPDWGTPWPNLRKPSSATAYTPAKTGANVHHTNDIGQQVLVYQTHDTSPVAYFMQDDWEAEMFLFADVYAMHVI